MCDNGGLDLRGIMAAGAEHHSGIGEPEPVHIEPWEVAHEVAHEGMPFASQHHPVREADRVRGRGDKSKSSQGAHGSLAVEVHIQNNACQN
jgi:hypothetical protein